jgi:hypothetical protein
VAVASEVLEAFGGAGYLEDTGLPVLLRDAQVLTIWEGTTNVLALDALRALAGSDGLAEVAAELAGCTASVRDAGLAACAAAAEAAIGRAGEWLTAAEGRGPEAVEAGARRFALTLGRALELALLARHAQWSLDREGDRRATAAAARLLAHGIDATAPADPVCARALANDEPLPHAT